MIETRQRAAEEQLKSAQQAIRRLPTLESQTIEWFRVLEDHGASMSPSYSGRAEFRRGGFRFGARSEFWKFDGRPLWGCAIYHIEAPPKHWGRGWSRGFLEMVFHLMPHDVLILEQVVHPGLALSFSRKPEYHRFRGNTFVRFKALAGRFSSLLLISSSFEEYGQLGGTLPKGKFSPAVNRFGGYRRWQKADPAAVMDQMPEMNPLVALLGPDPDAAIIQLGPVEAAEFLVHCSHLGVGRHLDALRGLQKAHPDEAFWLDLTEALEKAKPRPDLMSAEIQAWRQRFNEARAQTAPEAPSSPAPS